MSKSEQEISLKASARERSGTSSARALRRGGQIPATLYGGETGAQAIAFDAHSLTLRAKRAGFMSTVCTIDLDGKAIRALPREAQIHPLNGKILHLDFLRLMADSLIDVEVRVRFINEETSPGLKRGGVLNIVRHAIELKCPAESIPEELIANLDGLDIGDSIHIAMIELPDNVTPTITDRDFTVATIAAPAALRSEEEEAAEAEAAEAEAEAAEKAEEDDKGDKGDKDEGGDKSS